MMVGKVDRRNRLASPAGRRFLISVVLAIGLFLVSNLFADKAVSIHPGATGSNQQVARGCVYVEFDLASFSGTIGNATFSSATKQLQMFAQQDGTALSAIPYSVTGGTLIIVEVR